MKLQLPRETLVTGVGRTQGVVDRRGTTPILGYCLLEAQAGKLMIGATDYETSFRGYYPAEVSEEGGLCVPAVNFFNIIKELPEGELELSLLENNSLKVSMGRREYKFFGLPVDKYPPLPPLPTEPLVDLPAPGLREMLEKTIFSTSMDELQQHLSGVYFEPGSGEEEPRLRLVSSDGHRLSLVEKQMSQRLQLVEEGILVPRKGVAEMLRMLEGEEECGLGLLPKMVVLKRKDEYLFVRLLDRKFPNYQRILPQGAALKIEVGRRSLMEILRRISLLTTERFKGVILKIDAEALEVRLHNSLIGEGAEILPIKVEILAPEGLPEELQLPFEVSYNARYLLEPLSVMKSEEVRLGFQEKKRPVALTGENDPGFLSIVMPMELG